MQLFIGFCQLYKAFEYFKCVYFINTLYSNQPIVALVDCHKLYVICELIFLLCATALLHNVQFEI